MPANITRGREWRMPNRYLSVVGLASLLIAGCDSTGSHSGADVASGWFGVVKSQNLLTVMRSGRYEFLLQPDSERRTLKRSAGQLESSVLDQLNELLNKELRHHYYEHRTADDQRCRDEGGYSLVHGGGCWIVDEVTDDKTKKMLDVLVPLYKEKEAEAVASPNVADSDASVPTTELGTPHK